MWKLFKSKNLILISIALISTVIASKVITTANNTTPDFFTTKKQLFTAKPVVDLNESATNTSNNFLIAAELIDRSEGQAALAKLQGLEREYPLLTAHILLARGKAHQLDQNPRQAEATWQDAEPPDAGAKTVAGTDPASSVATYFED